jgi:hypothetical protein
MQRQQRFRRQFAQLTQFAQVIGQSRRRSARQFWRTVVRQNARGFDSEARRDVLRIGPSRYPGRAAFFELLVLLVLLVVDVAGLAWRFRWSATSPEVAFLPPVARSVAATSPYRFALRP